MGKCGVDPAAASNWQAIVKAGGDCAAGEVRREYAAGSSDLIAAKSRHRRREAIVKNS